MAFHRLLDAYGAISVVCNCSPPNNAAALVLHARPATDSRARANKTRLRGFRVVREGGLRSARRGFQPPADLLSTPGNITDIANAANRSIADLGRHRG